MVVNRIIIPDDEKDTGKEDQNWENPQNPEQASDQRDLEQLQRQKKTAEIRKNNLSDPEEDTNKEDTKKKE